MSRSCSIMLVAIATVWITLGARATVYCVSPSGSATNAGTPSSPLSLQAALERANAEGGPATVSLLAGTYCATGGLTIGAAVLVQGAGVEQSLIVADLATHDMCAMQNLQVVGSLSGLDPDTCVLVNNVKLAGQATGIRLTGTWLDMEGRLHVSNIATPPADTEAPNWVFVSNFVAQALAEAGKKRQGKMDAGGIYEYADQGDAAVSNFAIAYTDTQVVEVAALMTSNVTAVSNLAVAAAADAYQAAIVQTLDTAGNLFVNSTGDVMSGTLGVQGLLTVAGNQGNEQSATRIATSAVAPNGKWTTPTACFLPDGIYAECIGGPDYLDVTGWGFSVPANLPVNSVQVRFTGIVSGYGSANYTVLINGHEISGSKGHYWVGQFDVTDDWIIPLTPAELNAATFGVRINSDIGIRLDSVTMTACYGQPATIGEVVTDYVRLNQPPVSRDYAASVAYVDDKVYTGANIEDSSVEGAKLADATVTADKLATDVDARYLMKQGEQTVQGPLTIQNRLVAYGPWEVRDVPLTLMGANARITTEPPTDLAIAAGGDRAVIVGSEMRLLANNDGNRGQIGSATAAGSNTAVRCDVCTSASIVIITPTADIGEGNRYWIEPGPGSFILRQASPGGSWSFNYLVVNPAN